MRMISYAQNGEDVVLNRVFKGRDSGFYIDVGANDPIADSVTLHFYEQGWRGINIEPATNVFERLAIHRPDEINLNVGLSKCQSSMTFYDSTSNQALSTFSRELAEMWRGEGATMVERTVPVTTLKAICEVYCDRPIDFMKIDVEGHEREVLEGGDWDRWRPRVLVVEATWPERWEHLLTAARYHQALFDGINRFYVRDEDREWLSVLNAPPNVMDGFDPYLYVKQLQEAQGRIDELQAQISPPPIGIRTAYRMLNHAIRARAKREMNRLQTNLRSRSA